MCIRDRTQAGQAQTGQSGAGTTEEGGAGELTGKLVIMTNASGGTFEAMNEVCLLYTSRCV